MRSMRLALLIAAASEPGETAMHADALAMLDALTARGFDPNEIAILDGVIGRDAVVAFFELAHRRIAAWDSGDVFLFYTGHGTYWPGDALDFHHARPGLKLSSADESLETTVFWDEIFSILRPGPGVNLTILPDC